MRFKFKEYELLIFFSAAFFNGLIILLPFIATDLGLSLSEAGILKSIGNLITIITALPISFLAIRFGSTRVILFAIIIYTLAYLLTSVSSNYLSLLLAFCFTGFSFGTISLLVKPMILNVDRKERGRRAGNATAVGEFGKIAVSSTLGFIVLAIGWNQTTVIMLLIGLLVLVVYLFKRHQTLRTPIKQNLVANASFKQIVRHPPIIFSLLVGVLDIFSSTTLIIFIPFLLLAKGLDIIYLPIVSTIFLVGNVFGKFVLGRLLDKYPSADLLILAELVMAVLVFLLPQFNSLWFISPVAFLLGLTTRGTGPVVLVMISEATDRTGGIEKVFALDTILKHLSASVAPIVFGLIGDNFGIETVFTAYAVSALLVCLPALGFKFSQPSLKS